MNEKKHCSNCNGIIYNGCCLVCGLMENGEYANSQNTISKYDIFRNYNEDFDTMFRNENAYIPFLIGHLYFSYRNHLFIGLLAEIIEILFFLLVYYFLDKLVIFSNFFGFTIVSIIVFVIVRLLFYFFSNKICITLDEKKVSNNITKQKKTLTKSSIKLFINLILDFLIIYKFLL